MAAAPQQPLTTGRLLTTLSTLSTIMRSYSSVWTLSRHFWALPIGAAAPHSPTAIWPAPTSSLKVELQFQEGSPQSAVLTPIAPGTSVGERKTRITQAGVREILHLPGTIVSLPIAGGQ